MGADAGFNLNNATIGEFRVQAILYSDRQRALLSARRTQHFEQSVQIEVAWASAPDELQILERRQAILTRLRHNAILPFIDSGIITDSNGATLGKYLVQYPLTARPLIQFCINAGCTLQRRVQLLIQVCDLFAYVHSQLIAHGDLRQEDVFVDSEERILVVGWGRWNPNSSDPHSSSDTSIPRALSPVVRDLHQLGTFAQHLISCADPSAPPQTSFAAAMRGDLGAILSAAKSHETAVYADLAAFGQDLRNWLHGYPVQARPVTLPRQWWMTTQRNKTISILSAAVIVTSLAACAVIFFSALSASHQQHIAEDRLRAVTGLTGSLEGGLYRAAENLNDSGAARTLLLDQSRHTLDSLQKDIGDDPRLRLEVGKQYRALARLEQKYPETHAEQQRDRAQAQALFSTIPVRSCCYMQAQQQLRALASDPR